MANLPTLLVVYDDGAARPVEIYNSLRELAHVIFVPTDSDHATAQLPLMEACTEVVRPNCEWDTLVSELGQKRAGGIVTFSGRTVQLAGDLAQALSLPYHSAETLERLTDKAEQRRRLFSVGVDLTEAIAVQTTADLQSAIERLGLPAVLKPRRGGGSQDTYYLRSHADCEATDLPQDGSARFIVEPFLGGKEERGIADYVSVESVVCDGDVQHFAVTGKLPLAYPFRETGQFWPACLNTATRSEVLTLVADAVQALGVQAGITHTEVKLTSDGPRILEVNGRLGGHIEELLNRVAGMSALRWGAQLALGQTVRVDMVHAEEVHWQFSSPAPRNACRLQSIEGGREVTEDPSVRLYRPYVRPGEAIEAGVHTNMLDITCGVSANHEDMITDIARAIRPLRYSFVTDAGVTTLKPTELMQL